MEKPVDPIKEANVYVAYGRHAQAAQILEAAILEDPTRQDLKLKLDEVHSAARSRVGLNGRQRIIVFALLVVAATLKFLADDSWLQIAGLTIGLCALVYMAVCMKQKPGA